MTENWSTNPTSTGQGMASTRPKSARLSVVPMPNMITWIRGTMRIFKSAPNHVPKAAG
jgi:hypothetical protein